MVFRTRHTVRLAGLITAVLLLGCGHTIGPVPVDVSVAPQANDESPVAVDVVVIHDKALLQKLLSMSARDWFSRSVQLRRDYQSALEVWRWEVVPGQERLVRRELSFRDSAKGAVVFANYYTPGDHRARINPRKPLRVVLEEDGFTIEGEPESGAGRGPSTTAKRNRRRSR
jgi:type VI secretion system protein